MGAIVIGLDTQVAMTLSGRLTRSHMAARAALTICTGSGTHATNTPMAIAPDTARAVQMPQIRVVNQIAEAVPQRLAEVMRRDIAPVPADAPLFGSMPIAAGAVSSSGRSSMVAAPSWVRCRWGSSAAARERTSADVASGESPAAVVASAYTAALSGLARTAVGLLTRPVGRHDR